MAHASSALTPHARVSLFQPGFRARVASISMRVPSIVGAVAAIALALFVGCGSPPPTSSPDVEDHLCPVLFPAGSPVDTVTVALFGAVDATHAPNWTNRSEQIVFTHLYETLSIESAMCDRDALARAILSDSGRVATFTLRAGARYWDGTPVNARDVVDILRRGLDNLDDVDSLVALDEHRLQVHVARADFDWTALESPALAIVKRDGPLWPVGTGSYRIGLDEEGTTVVEPMNPDRDPVVRFLDTRNVDPRDLIDGSFQPLIDMMVLDDAVAVGYARSQGLERVELSPAVAYVWLSPSRADAIHRGGQLPMIPLSALQAMVRDAVTTANAQPLEESDPRWTRSLACSTAADRFVPVPGYIVLPTDRRTHRIAYDKRDPMSRDIVERIIALAGGDTSSSQTLALLSALPGILKPAPPVALGIDQIALAENLRHGNEFAYVVAVRLNRPEPCFVKDELVRAAPWLALGTERKALPICVVGSYVVAAKVDRGYGYDLRLDPYGGFIVVGRNPGEPR